MNPSAGTAVASVLPILLLIGLGMLLRRLRVLDDAVVAGLKQLIVSVALPAVLFITFLTTTFEPQHLWVVLIVFAVCVLLLGVGRLFARVTGSSPYSAFLFTGFELGMIGFALFAAVYGADRLPALGVLALGHEVFIWFVFVTLLRAVAGPADENCTLDGSGAPISGSEREIACNSVRHEPGVVTKAPVRPILRTLRSLITSPTIVAILLGLAANFAGLGPSLGNGPIGTALMATLKYLAAVIVPLVLLIVGYGSRLSWTGVRAAFPLVASRLVVVLTLALSIGWLVFDRILGLEVIYRHALFTLMVLPPPFIVPLFIPAGRKNEAGYVNNVLSVYSLVSVAVFVGYVVVTSP